MSMRANPPVGFFSVLRTKQNDTARTTEAKAKATESKKQLELDCQKKAEVNTTHMRLGD